MRELTEKQKNILQFIEEFSEKEGMYCICPLKGFAAQESIDTQLKSTQYRVAQWTQTGAAHVLPHRNSVAWTD